MDRTPVCRFSRSLAEPRYGYLVSIPIGRDITYWFNGPEVGRAIPIEIGGFPAVQYGMTNPYDDPSNDNSTACFVNVGVADDQLFSVQFSPDDRDDPAGLEAKCEPARDVAEMVLANLSEDS